MVVVIFRSRTRDDADLAAMDAMGERMYSLARAMPGYLSYKEFQAADGETLTLVEFEDEASLLAWPTSLNTRPAKLTPGSSFLPTTRSPSARRSGLTVSPPPRAAST